MAKKVPSKPVIVVKKAPFALSTPIEPLKVEPPKVERPTYSEDEVIALLSKIQLALEKATKDTVTLIGIRNKADYNELKTILMLIENAQSHISPIIGSQ